MTTTSKACTLPSGESAGRLVRGDMSALPLVLLHMMGRAAIIGVGAYAVGFRKCDLVKVSLAGALAIETVVLLYATAQASRDEATEDTQEAKADEQAAGFRRRLTDQKRRVVMARLPGAPRCASGALCYL